jgi:glycerol kinase
MIFDGDGTPIASRQLEHEQILPRPGWVEHDPLEIVERTATVVRGALGKLTGK